jgi:hypothetical protein
MALDHKILVAIKPNNLSWNEQKASDEFFLNVKVGLQSVRFT